MSEIADVLKELKKKKFDVAMLSDDDSPCIVADWLPTGCLALDAILGGGLPIGRVTECFGDSSTGKSLLAAMIAAEAQEQGHIVAMIDTETAASISILEAVGVDVSKLIYAAPDSVEEVFDFMEHTIKTVEKTAPDRTLLIIWDSIAATSALAELNAEYGKSPMGVHARLISQGMRKLNRQISKGQVCAFFTNQTRSKIGVMFGDNETTFGGKAMEFYSSIRIRLKKMKKIVVDKEVIGINTKATIVKNKVAAPFGFAELPIYFGHGIDDAESALIYMKRNGNVLTTGGWSKIHLDGEVVKFQKGDWSEIFDNNYDEIVGMILGE